MRSKLTAFEYAEASSPNEALSLFHAGGEKARYLAGGTDLLVSMRMKGVNPQALINIKTIPGLDGIERCASGYRVGSLATMEKVAEQFASVPGCECLSQAASVVGSWQVRCRATIGGNLCNGAPSAETAPALLVLNANAVILDINGTEKNIPMDEFFLGPGVTQCTNGAFLTEIFIPTPKPGFRSIYIKHSPRIAMDIAVVGVAVGLSLGDDQCVEDARIALGAVAPTPIRALEAEKSLIGKRLEEATIEKAGILAARSAKPISDVRASAEYRLEMVETLTKRALIKLSYGVGGGRQ
jgi:carbon-monoxide dehydrogenase medium subunit